MLGPCATSALADILFLDLNGSMPEVRAARAAATSRGERLVVIPDMPDSTRETVAGWMSAKSALERQEKAADDEITDLTFSNSRLRELYLKIKSKPLSVPLSKRIKEESQGIPGTARLSQILQAQEGLQERAAQIDLKVDAVRIKYAFDHRKIAEVIAKIEAGGRELTSIIVSGHQSINFSGVFSPSIDHADLGKVLAQSAHSKSTVKSVYLWGCYAATQAGVQEWKHQIPSLQMIAGFWDKGPSGFVDTSGDFLKSAMIKEQSIAKEANLKKLKRLYNQLEDAGIVSGAIANRRCYVGNGIPSVNLGQPRDCSQCLEPIKTGTRLFKDYFEGKRPVPANTHQSDLRRYYGNLQKYLHCKAYLSSNGVEIPPLERVIALIFWNNVRARFIREAPDAQKVLDIATQKRGIPRIDLATATREQAGQIKDLARSASHLPGVDLGTASKLQYQFYNLNVPLSWVID